MKITDALRDLLCAVIFDSFVMVFCVGVAAPWWIKLSHNRVAHIPFLLDLLERDSSVVSVRGYCLRNSFLHVRWVVSIECIVYNYYSKRFYNVFYIVRWSPTFIRIPQNGIVSKIEYSFWSTCFYWSSYLANKNVFTLELVWLHYDASDNSVGRLYGSPQWSAAQRFVLLLGVANWFHCFSSLLDVVSLWWALFFSKSPMRASDAFALFYGLWTTF